MMHAGPRGRLRRAVLCLAVLALMPVAACDNEQATAPDRKPKSSQSQTQKRPTIFDGSVIVGVKKGQPGFSTRSGYDYAGFEIALVDQLAEYARFKGAEKLDLPSLRRETILKNGGRDMVVATYSITPGRDEEIDFTAPYFKTYQGLLVRQNDDSIKTLEDLKGKQVCTASGSTSDPDNLADERASKAAKEALGKGVIVTPRTDYKECVKSLIDGNFQAVWTDEILLQGFAHAKRYAEHVKVVPGIEVGRQEWYGVGLHEGQVKDCRRLNRALKEFLLKDWTSTFKTYFGDIVKKQGGSFEQKYRPTPEQFERFEEDSCGAKD